MTLRMNDLRRPTLSAHTHRKARTKRAGLLLMLACLSVLANAQNRSISGTIIEKGTGQAVQNASVQVLLAKDSTFVGGKATDEGGAFVVSGLSKGRYIVKISFVGYQTRYVDADLTADKDRKHDLGYLRLTPDAILLDEATVTANAAKVQVSGDSLVFNADAYRVPEGSTLEDLVKKLPGVTVDDDGTVKVNGKEVQKILVDGKEFFINDKTVALKNLPTTIIDKIKTYDRKSDLARVTGIDDGEEETVLDLTVKKGMNNGWFGQISVGGGTEDRYSARANVNHFNGSNQYSFIGNMNNVGDRGFGGGGGRGWGRGGSGLRTSKDVGLNFATETDKLESGGYVRWRYDGTDVWTQSSTESFLTESGAFSTSTSQAFTSNSSLAAGFRFEWKPDTMTNIIFRPSGNYSRNRGSSYGNSGTYDSDPNDYDPTTLAQAEDLFANGQTTSDDDDLDAILQTIVNTNLSRSQTYSTSKSLSGELQINRKLSSHGRNITLRLTGSVGDGKSRQLSASSIQYSASSGKSGDINNRYYTTPERNFSYTAQATYSEPIAYKTYLQLRYQFSYSYTRNDRQAYTFDSQAYADLVDMLQRHRYDIAGAVDEMLATGYTTTLSDSLSQLSEYRHMNHLASITFRLTRDAYNINVGVDLQPQHSELSYRYMGNDYPKVTRNVLNLSPMANVRVKFSETSNLHLRIRGRSTQPSMTNLLDITDDSDPLNITKGNPRLKPSFTVNTDLFFNTYNVDHQRGIFAHASFSTTSNSIANRTSYDESTGVKTTQPENINGNWNGSGGFGFNGALDKDFAFTVGSFTNVSYANSVSYLDPEQYAQEKSTTKTLTISERIEWGYRNDWFEGSLNGSLTYNHSDNNVISDSRLNTYTFSYGLDMNVTAPWGSSISTDIAMDSRRGYSQASMNTNELIWNAQVSQSFLAGNALTLSFEWNDILQKRSNISRTISSLQSSDSRYNAVYSYGMIRVTYKLNIFAGKNANGTDQERDQWGRTKSDSDNKGNRRGQGGPPPGGPR